MIPWIATVRIGHASGRGFRLWVPLAGVWLLLLPVALLLAPLVVGACLVGRVNPLRAFRVFWGILDGVRGTRVEVAGGGHSVLVWIA